jgi:TetR/AcrR family transcriptional regulator, transcriptional repressor for nem operon
MPYSSAHRQKVRQNIIDSARRLFNRHGFDGVSIDGIMAGAQLTHGSFYSYFASKGELYTEVMACFLTDPHWKNTWEGIHIDMDAAALGPQIIRAYLSRQHFEDVENSCPMVALPSDVARSGKSAQHAFETAFKAMVKILEQGSSNNDHSHRMVAQAVAALCVGGMVVARAVADRTLADELRGACMAVALQLGGWDETAGAKQDATDRHQLRAGHSLPPARRTPRRAGT